MYRFISKTGRATTISQTTVDGRTVVVGDSVCFKSDIEQSGRITKIERDMWGYIMLHLTNPDGFEGGYIGGQTSTVEFAADCWID